MSYIRDIMLGALVGALVAVVAAYSAGMLSAIAINSSYIDWLRGHDATRVGMLAWDLVVVGLPGLLLPALIITLVAVLLFRSRWKWTCGAAIAVYLGYICVEAIRTAMNSPQFVELNGIAAFVPSPLLPIGVVAGGYLASRLLGRASSTTQTTPSK